MKELLHINPQWSEDGVNGQIHKNFVKWFKAHSSTGNITNHFILDLENGSLRSIRTYPCYYVDGYKFHVTHYGSNKFIMNSRVSVNTCNNTVYEVY